MKISITAPKKHQWSGVIPALTCKYLNQVASMIEVQFVSSSEIHKLNLQFRNKDYPTDILSFTFDKEFLGLLVVCEAIIASKNPKIRFREVLAKTLIHGTLHLCGYDHETDVDAEKMETVENQAWDFCNSIVII